MRKRYASPEKFLACGDLHARRNSPHYRMDDYWQAFRDKLEWILGTANSFNARILIAGDLFDSSRVPLHVVNTVTFILQLADHVPYVVPGQHDLLYHTDLHDTPLFNLHMNGVVEIISGHHEGVTGVGFGQEIPEGENEFLLIHKSITPKEPPFFLQDAVSATGFMKAYPNYKYIISGDYHPWHYTKMDGRHLINCGCLMRNKKDMREHKPVVWLIDTEKDEVATIEVPHSPFDEVFDVEAIEYNEAHGIVIDTTKIKELILVDGDDLKLSTVVWHLYNETKGEINKALVQEILEGCEE